MVQGRGTVLTGFGIGASLMYFLDPERGRRRRALVRDQLAHTIRLTRDAAGATRRDVGHRTAGPVASLGSLLRRKRRGCG
jgi:hypothetical protein